MNNTPYRDRMRCAVCHATTISYYAAQGAAYGISYCADHRPPMSERQRRQVRAILNRAARRLLDEELGQR